MSLYRVEGTRTVSGPLAGVAWNPEKDVLALLAKTGSVTAQRLSWNRVRLRRRDCFVSTQVVECPQHTVLQAQV